MPMLNLFLDTQVVLIFGCLLSIISWDEFYDDPVSVASLTTLWMKCVYEWLNKYFKMIHQWYFTTLPFAKTFNQLTTTSIFLFVWACLRISPTYVVWYFLLLIYYKLVNWNTYFITRNKLKDTIEIKFEKCGCSFTFWDQSMKLTAVKYAAGDWSDLPWGYDFQPGECKSYMEKVHAANILASIMVEVSRCVRDVLEECDEIWVDCVCCPACSELHQQQLPQTATLEPYCACCPACSDSNPQTSTPESSGAKQKKISNQIKAKSIKNKTLVGKEISKLVPIENKNNKSANTIDKKLNINKTKPAKEVKTCNTNENMENNMIKVKKQLLVNNKNFIQKDLNVKFSESETTPYPYFFQAGIAEQNNRQLFNRINKLQAWFAEAPRPGGGSLRQSFFTFHVLRSLVDLAESQTKLRPHFVTPQHTKQLRRMARTLTNVQCKLSELGEWQTEKWTMMKSIWLYLREWRCKLGGKPFKQNVISFPMNSGARLALLLYVKGTHLDKLTCLLALGPVRQCEWCNKPEKQPGSLHLCRECVTSDFPDVSVTCSRTCSRRWWKLEHWAEHMEHSLGLYKPKTMGNT